jgi:hypothetical protein
MQRDSGIALGFAISLALLSLAAEAQVFKCKDAEGKVTYTDVPCLRSETGSVVDTRSSVVDNSSLRKEAARLPSREVTAAPQGHAAAENAAAPPPEQPAPRREQRSNGYSR